MSASTPIKLLGMSGSLRSQSYNSAALRLVGSMLPEGMTFDVASLTDIPFYNADVEQRGFPAPVENFRAIGRVQPTRSSLPSLSTIFRFLAF